MCCPAVYVVIFRSHIHISATFWWPAVAALPTKTTLNNECADPGSEALGMGTCSMGTCPETPHVVQPHGGSDGPGDTGPRRLCQGHKTEHKGGGQPSTQPGQKRPCLKASDTQTHQGAQIQPQKGGLKENGPANTRDGGKWKGHFGGQSTVPGQLTRCARLPGPAADWFLNCPRGQICTSPGLQTEVTACHQVFGRNSPDLGGAGWRRAAAQAEGLLSAACTRSRSRDGGGWRPNSTSPEDKETAG